MAGSRKYAHAFQVNASLEDVAQFHRDSRALRLLSPPPMFIQFHEVQPLAEASLADFTMWLGPLPIRWKARHSEVNPMNGFIDVQEAGPFKTWVHRHSFSRIDANQSEVCDEIEATPGGLVSRLMWLGLPVLFAYRAWATRRSLER